MKPSLGDYDTHRLWEFSQGESIGEIFKAKSVPPRLYSHPPEQTAETDN